jgi:hypothetical protein
MDTVMLARLLGLAVLIVIFIATVLLTPRIFGASSPATPARPPEAPDPAASPAPSGAAARASVREAPRPVSAQPSGAMKS